jgi:hypothetical protein
VVVKGEAEEVEVFLQPLAGFVFSLADEVAELQHAAGAGFERLAVRPVHGAEADMLQLALGGVAGQDGGPEHHLEVVGLALVHHVEDLLRIEGPAAVQDGGQVRRAVHGRAFGGHHQQGRQVALVALAAYPDDPGALVVLQQAAGLQVGDHLRDQGVGVALALPEVEVHAQGVEVPGQGDLGHPGEVSP